MKNLLHRFSIIFICLYFISIPLLSYSAELNIYSHMIFITFFGLTAFYIMLSGRFVFSKGYVYYFFMFTTAIISTFWAQEQAVVSTQQITFALMFLLVILIINIINSDDEIDNIIKGTVWLGVAYFIYALIFYSFSGVMQALNAEEGSRLGGELNQSNSFGFLAAMTFITAFYYAYIEKKKLYYILAIVPAVLAFASGSRKALLIVVAGLFVLIILKREKNQIKTLITCIISLIAVYFALSYLSEKIFAFQRMADMFEFFKGNAKADSSIGTRLGMIMSGLDWFMEKPFFGHGTMQYNYLYYLNYGAFRPAHNNMIQILVDYGLVGFSIYYGMYIYIFKRLVRLFKKGEKLAVLMITLLICIFISGFTATVLYDKISTIYIALLLGYVGIHDISPKEELQLKIKNLKV